MLLRCKPPAAYSNYFIWLCANSIGIDTKCIPGLMLEVLLLSRYELSWSVPGGIAVVLWFRGIIQIDVQHVRSIKTEILLTVEYCRSRMI